VKRFSTALRDEPILCLVVTLVAFAAILRTLALVTSARPTRIWTWIVLAPFLVYIVVASTYLLPRLAGPEDQRRVVAWALAMSAFLAGFSTSVAGGGALPAGAGTLVSVALLVRCVMALRRESRSPGPTIGQ
jgi:hypothetical protein